MELDENHLGVGNTGGLQGLLASIDARLEQLCEKMNQVHIEVASGGPSPSPRLSLARNTSVPSASNSHTSSSFSFNRSVAIPKKSENTLSLQMIPSDRLEQNFAELGGAESPVPSVVQSGRQSNTSQPASQENRGSRSVELSNQSVLPSPTAAQHVSAPGKTSVVAGAPSHDSNVERSQRSERSWSSMPRRRQFMKTVDLQVAWKLNAKEAFADRDVAQMDAMMRLVERTKADHIWELLDDPSSSRLASALSWVFQLSILISISLDYANLIDSSMDDTTLMVFNMIFDTFFCCEVLLRLLTAPSKVNYIKDPLNWADLLSACALPFRIVTISAKVEAVDTLLFLFLPLVRFLKLLRYFEVFRLLIVAFQNSMEALPVLSYFMAVLVLFTATGIYIAEDRSNIPSFQHSIWLAVVTMTTVGFGDFVPHTTGGYIMVSVLTLVSVWFLALPVGIIGYEFTSSWKSRTRVLLITRTRDCLEKWGYSADGLNILFNYVDTDNDGTLNLTEFLELMRQMRIGINTSTAIELFQLFDENGSGSICYSEFLRQIYPEDFVTVRCSNDSLRKSSARVGKAMQHLVMLHWLGFSASHMAPQLASQVGHHGTGSLNFTELRGCMRQKVFSQMKTRGDDKASVFEGSIKDCLCQKCAMKDCLCELGLRQSDIRYFT